MDNQPVMLGCDLSHHNYGAINPSYLDFVILKATEGKTWTDSAMDAYVQLMADTVPDSPPFIGFYHYARPENNAPEEEVENFLKKIEPHIGNCFCALDYEQTAFNQKKYNHDEWAMKWCELVLQKTGTKPLIYTSSAYVHHFMGTMSVFPLWVAHYDVLKPHSKRCTMNPLIWQFSSKPFDVDILYGTPATFVNLIKNGMAFQM